MDYEVRLEIFEGPLDLLLHLIHKNEVDIFDIPIATITDQYLEYLDMMKALNINIAGNFLLMASTLIHIKSKMLLPDTKDEDEDDPRVEITRPLLEYMRFREIAESLEDREILDRDVFSRKVPRYFQDQLEESEPSLDVSLFHLMDAFKRIVELSHPDPQLQLQFEKWSVKDKTEFIMTRLKENKEVFFSELFSEARSIGEFIVTFLALLELVYLGLTKVLQSKPGGDIRVLLIVNKDYGRGEVT